MKYCSVAEMSWPTICVLQMSEYRFVWSRLQQMSHYDFNSFHQKWSFSEILYCYLYLGCNTVRFPRYSNQKLSRCHSKQYYIIGIGIIIIRHSDSQKKLSNKLCTVSSTSWVQGSRVRLFWLHMRPNIVRCNSQFLVVVKCNRSDQRENGTHKKYFKLAQFHVCLYFVIVSVIYQLYLFTLIYTIY